MTEPVSEIRDSLLGCALGRGVRGSIPLAQVISVGKVDKTKSMKNSASISESRPGRCGASSHEDGFVSETLLAQFPSEEGILAAFLPHEASAGDVTETMRAFYEDAPFPNYDGLETVGSLIEKSVARGFPEMLNRSIPPHASVLEVGCGTGQLGNFLSIANRKVLSVDLCWNSLRLAQQFKEKHRLRSVTFAQMNLFRMPLRANAFDVVICLGVLHHTSDPRGGFRRLVSLVKPGGHVLVGLYNRYGRLKTRLRRSLFSVLGQRFAFLDPYLRGHDLGPAKRRAWYLDQYRNPHESLHTMDEVLQWFADEGVHFVRALPSSIFGCEFKLDYRQSLFTDEARGSATDRLFSQLRQLIHDTEGGLFTMIGRKQ